MKKNKFLLVEYTAHFRNAFDNFKIFEKFYDCYFLISKEHKNKIKLKKKIVFKLPKFLIYFYVMLTGYKYKYIYFSTPPEYPDHPKGIKSNLFFLFEYIFFSLILFIYVKKIIFQLRGLHRYFPELNTPMIYSFLRNFYLKRCKIIVCESEYLKNKLINMLGPVNCLDKKILVIYYAYSKKNIKIKFKFNKKKINIGILGNVDKERKNYNILFKLLKNKFFLNKKIILTFLGGSNSNFSKKIINKFSKLCQNIISKNYFTDKEFLNFGKKCDFLISLNNKTNFYGKFRMSGCFGDAIVLKKYLYCPDFEDPYREFQQFTFYFKNLNSMIKNISICTNKRMTINFNNNKYKQTLKIIKNIF